MCLASPIDQLTVKSDGTVISATRDGKTVRFELKRTHCPTLQWSVDG